MDDDRDPSLCRAIPRRFVQDDKRERGMGKALRPYGTSFPFLELPCGLRRRLHSYAAFAALVQIVPEVGRHCVVLRSHRGENALRRLWKSVGVPSTPLRADSSPRRVIPAALDDKSGRGSGGGSAVPTGLGSNSHQSYPALKRRAIVMRPPDAFFLRTVWGNCKDAAGGRFY
jgi:hypothetical protein